jgi:hypothetical protein
MSEDIFWGVFLPGKRLSQVYLFLYSFFLPRYVNLSQAGLFYVASGRKKRFLWQQQQKKRNKKEELGTKKIPPCTCCKLPLSFFLLAFGLPVRLKREKTKTIFFTVKKG